MSHQRTIGFAGFLTGTAIAGVLLFSAVDASSGASFNVPLDHPVYTFIDILPLPGTADGVSLSSRPFTRHQLCTLLVYAKRNSARADKTIIDHYLREFSDTDSGSVKKVDVPIDGMKTHAYPYVATGIFSQDSGFTKSGFDAIGIDSLSSSVETYNKTIAGGRLYSDLNGFLSYFDGAIITEYGSKQLWEKTNDPRTGRNYTTIMAETGKPGHFIGYDDVTAYVKLPAKHYDVMLGFDRLQWGYAGASGLLFSGEGRPFLMAKASRRIGRLDYTFVLGKLTADTYRQNRVVYGKHITFAPAQWLSFGFSDAVISVQNGLKPPYFLPFVPFYFVEHYIGGNDNRIMSFDAQCNIRQRVSLYGELLIDEITNLAGFVTNNKANDIWAGIFGIKWYNPVPSIAASLLKAEVVQLEPWMYTRYSVAGETLSNYPVNFGHVTGNRMGPHSRNLSLVFSGMFSEKTRGTLGVSQYLKGAGPGSDIFSGNDFVSDTINGIPVEHQIYSGKDHRFKKFSRDRVVISASGTYTRSHWLQMEISGDFVREQGPARGNYFRAGVEVKANY